MRLLPGQLLPALRRLAAPPAHQGALLLMLMLMLMLLLLLPAAPPQAPWQRPHQHLHLRRQRPHPDKPQHPQHSQQPNWHRRRRVAPPSACATCGGRWPPRGPRCPPPRPPASGRCTRASRRTAPRRAAGRPVRQTPAAAAHVPLWRRVGTWERVWTWEWESVGCYSMAWCGDGKGWEGGNSCWRTNLAWAAAASEWGSERAGATDEDRQELAGIPVVLRGCRSYRLEVWMRCGALMW